MSDTAYLEIYRLNDTFALRVAALYQGPLRHNGFVKMQKKHTPYNEPPRFIRTIHIPGVSFSVS